MIKATWLGHSCWTIEGGGHSIIIDPFLTGNPLATKKPEEIKAEFIVITHGHGDHVGDALAIAKRNKAQIIANYEIVSWSQNQGAQGHPLHIGGSAAFPFGRHDDQVDASSGAFRFLLDEVATAPAVGGQRAIIGAMQRGLPRNATARR